jgi:transcriptional regulator with XRE-family HTH domain
MASPFNTPLEIGQRLRIIRKIREASLSDVAEICHISAATLSRIETGKQDLSVTTLLILCDALACAPDDVLLTAARNASSLLAALSDVERAKEAFAAATEHVENMEKRLRAFAGAGKGNRRKA